MEFMSWFSVVVCVVPLLAFVVSAFVLSAITHLYGIFLG